MLFEHALAPTCDRCGLCPRFVPTPLRLRRSALAGNMLGPRHRESRRHLVNRSLLYANSRGHLGDHCGVSREGQGRTDQAHFAALGLSSLDSALQPALVCLAPYTPDPDLTRPFRFAAHGQSGTGGIRRVAQAGDTVQTVCLLPQPLFHCPALRKAAPMPTAARVPKVPTLWRRQTHLPLRSNDCFAHRPAPARSTPPNPVFASLATRSRAWAANTGRSKSI